MAVIEVSREQVTEKLDEILGLVREGAWIRNRQTDGAGHGCILGLIAKVDQGAPSLYRASSLQEALLVALDTAIPSDALEELGRLERSTYPSTDPRAHGGYVYGVMGNREDRVATYNNTRADSEEIESWLTFAILANEGS